MRMIDEENEDTGKPASGEGFQKVLGDVDNDEDKNSNSTSINMGVL